MTVPSRYEGRKCVFVLALLAVLAVGCSRAGSEFVGKWVNTKNLNDVMEITRNGDQFLVTVGRQKIGATYKDGMLEITGMMGSVKLTHVKDTDTILTPGFFGQSEYKRVK